MYYFIYYFLELEKGSDNIFITLEQKKKKQLKILTSQRGCNIG